jgi:hypothetical protein
MEMSCVRSLPVNAKGDMTNLQIRVCRTLVPIALLIGFYMGLRAMTIAQDTRVLTIYMSNVGSLIYGTGIFFA